MIVSCENDLVDIEQPTEPLQAQTRTSESEAEFTVLGSVNEIPFTVQNMQEAYNRLKINPRAGQYPSQLGEYQINATHSYYRFLPSDSTEYVNLVNDTVMDVSDVPFEYDISIQGDKYIDPEMQSLNNKFTYYYAIVPANYQIPFSISRTLISDLHFTGEDEIGENPTEQEDEILDFLHDVNIEAHKISGNLSDIEKLDYKYFYRLADGTIIEITLAEATARGIDCDELFIDYDELDHDDGSGRRGRKSWNPHGRVTVEEGVLTDIGSANNIVGVAGARIKVRKWGWLVIRKTYTDEDGNFRTSSTKTKKVKYAVYFKDEIFFKIKAVTIFWDAKHRGHKKYKREGWFQHFSEGGRSHFYALTQNAAYDYYYKWSSLNPNSPFDLHLPEFGLRISAKYNGDGSNHTWFDSGFWAEIRVSRKSGDNYRRSDGIYATTIHEMTHNGHSQMDFGIFFGIYLDGNSKERLLMKESWAEGVETVVTNHRYQLLEPNYFRSANNHLGWNYYRQRHTVNELSGFTKMNEYTPIVSDLIDTYNQNIEESHNCPVDSVSGYTLSQIQHALDDARELEDWRDELIEDFDNATETYLHQLFEYTEEVADDL